MNLKMQKTLAAKILKTGVTRVRVENDPDVSEAITRNDIKDLIRSGLITTVQKKGTCNTPKKKRAEQKKKGRRFAKGSKKGTKNARKTAKTKWIGKIRPIRKMLKEMKEGMQLENADYRKLYSLAGGGTFRNKKHVLMYAKDHDMLKGPKPRKVKSPAKPVVKKDAVKTAKPVVKKAEAEKKTAAKKPAVAKKVNKDA